MYRGLIDHLSFVYGFICKGRGRVPQEDLNLVAQGAHVAVRYAPEVLGSRDVMENQVDNADLKTAVKMDEHIAEMLVFLEHLEIC